MLPVHHAVGHGAATGKTALNGRNGLHCVCPADGLRSGLRKAEVLDLASGDQFLHRARYILNRHGRIDSVLVEKVDGVYLQPVQHRINDFSDVVGQAVQPAAAPPGFRVDVKAEFRRDDHLIANWRERFANEFFVCERAVCLSGMEKGHTTLERSPKGSHAVLRGHRRTISRR